MSEPTFPSTPQPVSEPVSETAAEITPEVETVPTVIQVNRKRLVTVLTVTAIVLAGMVALVLHFSAAKPFPIHGLLIVDGTCGTGGFSDIHTGAQVELTNKKGDVLAIANLERVGGGYCKFSFDLPDVPAGEGLYGVHVGNNNRGVLWKTEDEARNHGFELSLGGI